MTKKTSREEAAREEHEFRIIVALGLIAAGVLVTVLLWLCVDYGKHQTCSEVGGTYRRSTFGGTCEHTCKEREP